MSAIRISFGCLFSLSRAVLLVCWLSIGKKTHARKRCLCNVLVLDPVHSGLTSWTGVSVLFFRTPMWMSCSQYDVRFPGPPRHSSFVPITGLVYGTPYSAIVVFLRSITFHLSDPPRTWRLPALTRSGVGLSTGASKVGIKKNVDR